MTSANQAVAKAKGTLRWAIGMCDNFVANMYGYSSSGYGTALVNWNATPTQYKHPNDMNAPAGALMYWGGGSGHVAISLGNGNIVSTDISGNGTVSTVPATAISDKWGKAYLGWAYPYFQGQLATDSLGGITGSTSVTNAGFLTGTPLDPQTVASGFIDGFIGPFKTLLGTVVWGMETLGGIALIFLGIRLMMVRKEI